MELSLFHDDEGDNIKRYLAVSVRNKYIALSKRKQINENFLVCESDLTVNDVYDAIFIKEMLEVLSLKQRKIIMYKYIYGYSDAEIADALGVSRQAVNRLKNRAFDILKKLYG